MLCPRRMSRPRLLSLSLTYESVLYVLPMTIRVRLVTGDNESSTFQPIRLPIASIRIEAPFKMPPQAAQPADAGEGQAGLSVRTGLSDFACLSRHRC